MDLGDERIVHRLNASNEHLEQIENNTRRLLALGEERLSLEHRILRAQNTQNLIGFLQLQQSNGSPVDREVLATVQKRLGL